MKTAFFILTLLHGLIHTLGFIKGFGIREIKELPVPISQPIGLLWLISALLFVVYIGMWHTEHPWSWLVGAVAVILSQIVIILFWSYAKFGTLPNLLILIVVVMSYGAFQFQRRVADETAALLNQSASAIGKVVTSSDLGTLPKPVQKWLSHSGMLGKPYIHNARVTQEAEMKLKPDQQEWMQATALQYTFTEQPSFIWSTHVSMNQLIYFEGRDKFEEGKGEMLIKINSIIKIVDEKGSRIDEGALQRYLGELVWFPSLALSPHISWEPIDDLTAKATLSYQGTMGSGIFHFNEHGDFIKFSAMRFMGNDQEARRFEWVLTVQDYRIFEGIRVPAVMTATWALDSGDWTWLRLHITDIQYNISS